MKNDSEGQGDSSGFVWKTAGGYLLFTLVVAGISFLLSVVIFPQVWAGSLFDPDAYMRMVRIDRLVDSWAWFDGSIPRSNAPFGEVLHWTRPLDILLLGGSLLFRPWMDFPDALFLSAVVLSPLLLLCICFGAGWAAVPLAGKDFRYFAMIGVLAQLGVMGYALPGRPDHHPLLLLCFVLVSGSYIRLVANPLHRGLALSTGVLMGVGVWVGTEFLLPAFLVLGSGCLLWILDGKRRRSSNLWVSWGFALGLLVAVGLEHPLSRIHLQEYDRVSIVHLFVAVLASLFWMGAAWVDRERGRGGRGGRLIYAMLAGGGTVLALFLVFPKFFGGPTVDVDPTLASLWLENVEEFRGFPAPTSVSGIGMILAYLGTAVISLPVLGWFFLRETDSERQGAWVFITLSIVLFMPLAVVRARFAPYPELLSVLVITFLLSRVLPWVSKRAKGWRGALGRAAAAAVLVTGSVFLGGGMMALGGASARAVRNAGQVLSATCDLLALAHFLNGPGISGGRSRTILSHVDFGPELLYRTEHRVMATPYHRNSQGVMAAWEILSSTDPAESRNKALARGVDLILLCPTHPSLYSSGFHESGGAPTLYEHLASGTHPAWLERVALPPETGGGFLLFEVVP